MTALLSSLRARLALMLLLAALPPMGIVTYQAREWRQHEVADAESAALELARHGAKEHERSAERLHGALSSLARRLTEGPRRPDAAETKALLENVRQQSDSANVGVFGLDGTLVATARPLSAPSDLRSTKHFQRAVTDRQYVTGDCRIDPGVQSATCEAFHPLPADTAATGQVLVAQQPLEWPEQFQERIPLPAGTTLAVLDERGTVLMHGSDRRWIGHSLSGEPVFEAIKTRGSAGTAQATLLDGIPRVFGFSALRSGTDPPGLYVAVGIPLRGATATADRLLMGVFLALGFTVVAGMALSWAMCEIFLVRRVKTLVGVTERLARGEQVMASAGGSGLAELERLARAFDRMSAALQARHGALAQSGDSVMVANREGVIEYVNDAFVRLTGFPAEEAIGARPRRVKRGQQSVDFYRGLWATVLSGTPFRAVFVNRRKDGSTYHEEQIVSPIRDAAGTITHFVSTGRDISDRRRAEDALRRLNERLEDETNRIASLLHDEAGQFLTACHITLSDVSRDLPASGRERIQEVRAHLHEVEAQLRRLAHELRPRILEDLGLIPALKFLAESIAKRTGVEIEVHAALETRCPPAVETAVYRLVQESLTNMMKHARATRARVTITEDAQAIHCAVTDDGVGFDMNHASPLFGLGLLGIQDRVEAVRGTLRIESQPERGTALYASIPLEPWGANGDVAAEAAPDDHRTS